MSTLKRVGLASALGLMLSTTAMASSHREAPAISKRPFYDNTDTYVFLSPTDSSKLVVVASWIPFQGPEGGPNYFEWDDSAEYKIHIDNDGDAAPDFTYTLQSNTVVRDDSTFLYNNGPINPMNILNSVMPSGAGWNRIQMIDVTEENVDASSTSTLFDDVYVAPANIGSKSTPNYGDFIAAATRTTNSGGDEIKMYAGQTDDPFFVDLQVFDLLTLRGQAAPIGYSTGNNKPVDSLAGYNVHTLVIEIPVSRLKAGTDPVLGVWSTTEVNGTQVSRLGMPLVNEVVLPYALKDAFNGLATTDDLPLFSSNAVLQKSINDPELGNLLCGLYGVPLPGDANGDCLSETNRGDIFDIYLQGMVLAAPFTINTANGAVTLPAGTNVTRPANATPAEMIRINTDLKDDICAPSPHPLGLLGGDACGFPNGRRLGDDVTDISLLAVGGAAYAALDGTDTSFSFNTDLIGVLSDNVNGNDQEFSTEFPYVAAPASGQERTHANAASSGSSSGGGGSMGYLDLLLLLMLSAIGGVTALRRRKSA